MTTPRKSIALIAVFAAAWFALLPVWSAEARTSLANDWTQAYASETLGHEAVKATPCTKLKAPLPAHKKCNRGVSSGPANGRTRSDDDDVPYVPLPVEAPVTSWYSYAVPLEHGRALIYEPAHTRSPFWAAYAATSRMRN